MALGPTQGRFSPLMAFLPDLLTNVRLQGAIHNDLRRFLDSLAPAHADRFAISTASP